MQKKIEGASKGLILKKKNNPNNMLASTKNLLTAPVTVDD
jgi:hypothetical protein